MTERRETLLPLTSLRFVAALLVLSWHCVPTRRVSATFSLGYAGVAFFFLLSGFILTYTYHDALRDRLGLETLRAFYAARIARVYPLHLVTAALTVGVLVWLGTDALWNAAGPQTRLRAVAAQLLLVQSWSPDAAIHFGANGPAWSISVEAFFYALFPFLAFGSLRAFGASPAHVVLLCAGALWLVEALVLWPQHAAADDWRWYVFPPGRLIDFVVGMLLGIAFLRSAGYTPAQFMRPLTARRRLHPTSVEILAVAGVCLAVYVSPLVPQPLRFSAWLMPAWCALIFVFAASRGAVSRGLSHPVAVRLGEISFAFYLCHLMVVKVIDQRLGWQHPLSTVLALGGTLALSLGFHHAVERPLRPRLRALLARRTSLAGRRACGRCVDAPARSAVAARAAGP